MKEESKEFGGRVALVTGGARGIGGGIATALARAGASVVIADILDDQGGEHAAELSASGAEVCFRHLDVRSEGEWRALCDELQFTRGRIDALVNAAGILIPGGIEEISYEQYKKVTDISADGTFLSLKYCLPLLKARSEQVPMAAVVNVSSIAAFQGAAGALSYAASRAAVLSMTKSAALEWAQRGYKIRVNTVHPGSVKTDLSNITYGKLMERGMTLEQAVAHMTSLHPLGRLGTIDDIAQAVMYLASDRASWVTGTSLVIDGGRLA